MKNFLLKTRKWSSVCLEEVNTFITGGGNVMCVCLYQKSVCKVNVPKVCTVGMYSTYEY